MKTSPPDLEHQVIVFSSINFACPSLVEHNSKIVVLHFDSRRINCAMKTIASDASNTAATVTKDAGSRFFLNHVRSLACFWVWLYMVAFATTCAAQDSAPASTMPAKSMVSSPAAATTLRWTCNAFYLPARNIWQRTVAVGYEGDVVRSVQIDDVVVYTFTLEGSRVLTGVDGERIQFDIAALTWTSDLRSLATSTGRCTL